MQFDIITIELSNDHGYSSSCYDDANPIPLKDLEHAFKLFFQNKYTVKFTVKPHDKKQRKGSPKTITLTPTHYFNEIVDVPCSEYEFESLKIELLD